MNQTPVKGDAPKFFAHTDVVDIETTPEGCEVAHVEDDTGEHVVLSVDAADMPPVHPKGAR